MSQPNEMIFTNRFGTSVKVTLDRAGRMTLTLGIDGPEGKGEIVLEESGYGWGLCFPELFGGNTNVSSSFSRIALLDLFHNGPEREEGKPKFQIVVDSPHETDDPLAHVQFFAEGTKIVTDPGIAQVESKYVHPFGKEYTISVHPDRVYEEEE